MKVSLSILNSDFSKLNEELETLYDELDFIHLDVMDGNFVPNISFGAVVIESLRPKTKVLFDTHLMINNPEKYISDFVKAGSDYITFHLEATENPKALIDYIHSFNVKAGISIKPNTDVRLLDPYLEMLDLILIMSVEPGFGGQSFMENQVEKLKYLKEKQTNYHYLISVDGGINDKTISKVNEYTDLVVSGSYITKASDKIKALRSLK